MPEMIKGMVFKDGIFGGKELTVQQCGVSTRLQDELSSKQQEIKEATNLNAILEPLIFVL